MVDEGGGGMFFTPLSFELIIIMGKAEESA